MSAPWLVALALAITAWEIVTAKLDLLPLPFFPSPQAFVEVYTDDWPRLGDSLLNSVLLLLRGFAFGAAVGFVIGVAIGWSPRVGYWIHPILRLIGPLPATAWLPLAFFIFPTSGSASTFLIALATAFPVAVLTWSGVAGVSTAYYDVARTLGASQRFLILKVAIPGRAAARLRRPVHGLGLVLRRAGRRRDAGREIRPRLVSAMGAGLGRLRQHVRARCWSWR